MSKFLTGFHPFCCLNAKVATRNWRLVGLKDVFLQVELLLWVVVRIVLRLHRPSLAWCLPFLARGIWLCAAALLPCCWFSLLHRQCCRCLLIRIGKRMVVVLCHSNSLVRHGCWSCTLVTIRLRRLVLALHHLTPHFQKQYSIWITGASRLVIDASPHLDYLAQPT